jgi:dipeptidyl aminopeptidase/acylaminoacyl peptidase
MQPVPTPFGSWPSPLSARDVAEASLGLAYATANGGRLYWIESRPQERGRSALVAEGPDGTALDVTGAASNVRSRVHEYGGRAYSVVNGLVAYGEFSDQRLYVQELGAAPRAVTPDGYRYADFAGGSDRRTLFAVREDHCAAGEPVNSVVAIDVDIASAGRVLFDRSDFVAYPRPSADGRIAFIAWNHPNMPWDATTLYVARLGADGLEDLRVIAGGPEATAESVIEPVWDVDGTLYFLSDRSGYWNVYRWKDGPIEAVTRIDADFGGPMWSLGATTYALTGDGRALARLCRNAVDQLVLVDLASGRLAELALPFVSFGSVGVLDAEHGYAIAASETAPLALITFSLRDGAHRVVRTAGPAPLAPDYVSRAEPIRFPTRPGTDGTPREAHAFFHPPSNPNCSGPKDTKPPLLVLVHGGPTTHAAPALSPSHQFWTTRGFAIVNVNYGGSSGFGRDYRNRLLGEWGVVDLADAVAAVDYLVAQGRVDGVRVAIRGGSAGGFTVLAGLAFTRRFAAGINYFGVADLESLAADTHKFESRYLDRLVAPLPEGLATYRARSPIHHLEALDAALITFQGDEDLAVPPAQSRGIVAAVRARGKPVAYLEFQGEQHGFRRAENIVRALEAELYFLGRIFGFMPADAIEPVPIDNLAQSPANGRSDR